MKYRAIVFGAHAMVYFGTNNRMDTRSIPAIALNASNEHGGHYFMSLYSGKRIHSYEWKELPIDEEVIARVEELAEEEEAPEMKRGYPTFTWKQRFIDEPDLNINDAIEDEVQVETNNDEVNIDEENENNDEEENEIPDQELILDDNEDVNEIINDGEPAQEETNYVSDESSINNDNEEEESDNGDLDDIHVMNEVPEEEVIVEEDDRQEAIENEEVIAENEIEVEVESNANSRPRRACVGQGVERLEMSMDNNKEYASVKEKNYQCVMESNHPFMRGDKSFMSVATNYLFTQVNEHAQMSAKAGIKKFGDKAVAAMLSEYKQLNTGAMPGRPFLVR